MKKIKSAQVHAEELAPAAVETVSTPVSSPAPQAVAAATTTGSPTGSEGGNDELLQPAFRRAPEKVEPMLQLIVFQLGAEEYAVRIGQVKEITVTPEIARMPRTPEFLKGVANIRGELIAVLDLEERFLIAPSALTSKEKERDARTYTLVVEAADYAIGILVRQMPQATTVPLALLERAPEFFQTLSVNDKYIEGLLRLAESSRVIILLDLLRLLRPEEILQLTPPNAVRTVPADQSPEKPAAPAAAASVRKAKAKA